jgi:hypothetical protein
VLVETEINIHFNCSVFINVFFFVQVQDGSPGQKAGLEAFFDFIVAIGNTRLVSYSFRTYCNVNSS